MCLDIIANAVDAERPGIKTYIETGARRDFVLFACDVD